MEFFLHSGDKQTIKEEKKVSLRNEGTKKKKNIFESKSLLITVELDIELGILHDAECFQFFLCDYSKEK